MATNTTLYSITPEKRRLAYTSNQGVSSPKGKMDFIRALDKSSSDDDSIWAMDAVGSHPHPVVETASLEGVTLPRREYAFVLPEEIRSRSLSAVQLEAIKHSCLQHEQTLPDGSRAGFFIGDGAGVGKGRTVSGIIFENYLRGRKRAIWVSASSDLKNDAERDLRDIGAGDITVHALNNMKYAKISADVNGSIKTGVIFSTYSSLIGESRSGGKYQTRLKQLLQWCGEDFDGVIVFDECHRAKNLVPTGSAKPTKTGLTVLELQNKLPKARIIYASATGASEPKNMGYMVRLGLWGQRTQFKEFADFIGAVEKRGVGGMETVAMEMKHRGMYIARQLSFKNVKYKVDEVALSPEFVQSYDDSVKLWVEMFHSFTKAAELVNADSTMRQTTWTQFWSAHQRFFKYLCIAAKVKHAVKVASEAVKCGKCVVISLQSTGEARTLEQIENEGELSDFVSTAKGVLQALVEKHFPAPDRSRVQKNSVDPESYGEKEGTSGTKRKAEGTAVDKPKKKLGTSRHSDAFDEEVTLPTVPIPRPPPELERNQPPSKEALDLASSMKDKLLAQIEQLGSSLPPNTLDQLIDELGGPENVAEMTGRKRRVVQKDDEPVQYESRSKSNIEERRFFMEGRKDIAIISEVASCGISLQDDRRFEKNRQRVHILLELPWSAECVIQQLGRTHRSNQASAPEYIFLISDLAGERRFVSIVAKRLESLGALTHGDRRATGRDLSQFNIDTKHGRDALTATMKAVMGSPYPAVPPPADYKGKFFKDALIALVGVGLICKSDTHPGVLSLDKDYANISKFLNRILGMQVDLQNRLFQYFTDTLATIVIQAQKNGNADSGLCNVGSGEDVVLAINCIPLPNLHPTSELHTFEATRGLSWEEAVERLSVTSGAQEGFYLSREERNVKATPVLVQSKKGEALYTISQPNKGTLLHQVSLAQINKKYKKVEPNDAKPLWVDLFASSKTECIHKYWYGKCDIIDCQFGLRQRRYHILSGPVLTVWTKVESVLNSKSCKMQILRLKQGQTWFGGINIPESCNTALLALGNPALLALGNPVLRLN